MWFGIIIFGVANGFILLPVLLSLCGPLNEVVDHDPELNQVSDEETSKKQIQNSAAKHPSAKSEEVELKAEI
jgi:hypothetical protein